MSMWRIDYWRPKVELECKLGGFVRFQLRHGTLKIMKAEVISDKIQTHFEYKTNGLAHDSM